MTARALVVDDAADLRLLVRTALQREGIDVDEAANGRDALDALAAGSLPDIVVLDIQMPELDGWDTLAAIRAGKDTASLPVIVCTVRSHPADIERAADLGADAVVTKPFAVDELTSTVARVLRGALG